jgi:class 3 adenylate cyclase
MSVSPAGGPEERSAFRVRELSTSWWEHRASFFISVGITLAALLAYYFTFLGERPTPIFNFLQRLELDTLDMRFTYRPASATPADPRLEAQVKQLVGKFDADDKFAAAIKNFGAVVLGSYFLYTDADMRGMDDATLDNYIGDAVMAFGGAPYEDSRHAIDACNVGIGLNPGVASVGNMGSALRYGYTALGDTVNLSSRLEGLNKDYGTHILVNESTYAAAKDAGFLLRELDVIRVKGKLEPVIIYELIGKVSELQRDAALADYALLLQEFANARELYLQREWAEAQDAILDRWPADGPSRMYWKRCQDYLFDAPPAAWDGFFTMTHK